MDEHHTPLSKQQLVQLIRSLILVEQVSILAISHNCFYEIRWNIFIIGIFVAKLNNKMHFSTLGLHYTHTM